MGYVVTRPDQAWRDAVELATDPVNTAKNPLKWLSASAAEGVCRSYVCGNALDQINADRILFSGAGDPDGILDDHYELLSKVTGSSMFDGIIWDMLKKLAIDKLRDPAILDTASGWLAAVFKKRLMGGVEQPVVGMTAEDFKIEAHGTVVNPGDK